MSIASIVLIFSFVGTLGAWRPDIDINRVRLLPKAESQYKYSSTLSRSPHSRRSIFPKSNDYDYHSSGFPELRSPLQFLPDALPSSEPKAIKVYKPRQDPRLFYLSDAYAKEVNEKNLNNEVSAVYPGGDVVHANDHYYKYNRPPLVRLREKEMNSIPHGYTNHENVCVNCPHDRTLLAQAGADRVILPNPLLKSCSGLRLPREIQYEHMLGPRFGSLLTEGSYAIVGRITHKGKILKHCFMEVHVLTQTCPLPKYLVAHCGDQNKTCNFACRDRKTELYGSSNLTCGDDNQWIGHLPICKVRSWCNSPPPPTHGRVSCKGSTVNSSDLSEGSVCRVRCARGWKPTSRSVAACHRGLWTHELNCTLTNN